MILAHLCDEPKGLKSGMFMSLVFLCFPIANALIAKINDGMPLVDELVLLLLYCAYTVGLYLHLAVSVVHEIKDALGIYCFRSANLCVILLSKKTAIFQLVITFSFWLLLMTG